MDLKDLDTTKGAEEGFALAIDHPKTGTPIGLVITVYGADGDAFQGKQREFLRKRTDRMQRQKRIALSPEELQQEAIELLVVATKGWQADSALQLDGAPLPAFSANAARDLYTRFGWIREQVDQAVNDRANFLPTSPTS